MKQEYIQQLIDRFFEAETTLEEERELYDFFAREDVPAKLEHYKELFLGFGKMPFGGNFEEPQTAEMKHVVARRSAVRTRTIRLIIGLAASLLLVLSATMAYTGYDNYRLDRMYGGSYMVMNGKRTDNLRQMRSHISRTLASADSIEQHAMAESLIEDIENDVLNSVGNGAEHQLIMNILKD